MQKLLEIAKGSNFWHKSEIIPRLTVIKSNCCFCYNSTPFGDILHFWRMSETRQESYPAELHRQVQHLVKLTNSMRQRFELYFLYVRFGHFFKINFYLEI